MKHEQLPGMIISSEQSFVERIMELWSTGEFTWRVYARGDAVMPEILSELPAVIIVNMALPGMNGVQVSAMLKSENLCRQVPVFLCLDKAEFASLVEPSSLMVDDFFILPGDDAELKSRIMLTALRATCHLDANPLTRLPGNNNIFRYVQDRIDSKGDFALCYCDLDHFKAFNDKYGFTRGDEVLLMSARLIASVVRNISPDDFFVGHIGGDDFIFVLPSSKAEDACKQIIAAFDDIVPQFYDKEDRERGSIVAPDRQGVVRIFSLMAISIAVIDNSSGRLTHVGQASALSTSLKNKAKSIPTSSYIIDRRSN